MFRCFLVLRSNVGMGLPQLVTFEIGPRRGKVPPANADCKVMDGVEKADRRRKESTVSTSKTIFPYFDEVCVV